MDDMKSSRESLKGSFYDNSCDILQNFPWNKSFHLNSESLEMTKHPNSPSPICSPLNQPENDNNDTAASLSFSFFTPRNSFAQSDLHISRLGEEVAGSTRTTINEENEGKQSTFHDLGKSTSASLLDPKSPPAPKEEICPHPRIQQGHSVRRANLPRRCCRSEPQIVLPEETQDQAPLLSEIAAVQANPVKDQDSDASNASKNAAAENPENISEGFESSNPVENFHPPVTKEEENLETNDTSIKVLSGTNGSSSKPTNEEIRASDPNVEERSGYTANIERSSDFMTESNERRDETIALQEATYLIRLKREEERIKAWERNEIAEANKHMKNFERKLEKRRVEEMWKTQKKIARTHQKAENRKVAKRTKFEAEESGGVSSSLAKRIRSRKLPWKWVSATVCCVFVK